MKLKLILLITLSSISLLSQPKWKAEEQKVENIKSLFNSTQTASFQTTESLDKGNWMYEISHRFIPSINDGIDALYGFDGPAIIRFALAYGITDELMFTFGRSSNTDNYDFQLKQKISQLHIGQIPLEISLLGGFAINTEVPNSIDRGPGDFDNFQFYSQFILNTMLFDDKLGVGIIPSYLYNSFIYAVDKQYTLTIGTYFKYYLSRVWSILLEYNAIVSGYQGRIRLDEIGKSYNTVGFGFSLDTGGHIFQIMLTNNARLNPSQYLVGADRSVRDNE